MTRATPPTPQSGIALVTAMLVVAIVATVAAALAVGQQLWLRQAQNLAERAQAEALRQGAINYALVLLARDATQGNTDHLDELWAKPLPPLPAEGGLIAVAVRDAQGRFNLNNLVRGGAPSAPDIAVFQRLLRAEGLSPALTEAIIDWLDPDGEVRPGGAEDIDYMNLPQPYRAANQAIASVDELRLIKGFDAAGVDKLRPFLVALPEPTAVNVNTAEPAVLAALFPDMTVAALKPFLDRRQRQPLTAPGELTAALPTGTPAPQAATGVTTGYFLVTIEVRLGRLQQRSEALIQRPAGGKPATLVWQRRLWPQPSREQDDEAT